MLGRSLLTPLQFARLGAFLEWHPDDVADALADASFGLSDCEAARVAVETSIERRRLDAIDAGWCDEVGAILAEHDTSVSMHGDAVGPWHQATPSLVREAYRVAVGMRLIGLAHDELCAVVHGAFLVSFETAYTIASAAVEEHPDVVERPLEEPR